MESLIAGLVGAVLASIFWMKAHYELAQHHDYLLDQFDELREVLNRAQDANLDALRSVAAVERAAMIEERRHTMDLLVAAELGAKVRILVAVLAEYMTAEEIDELLARPKRPEAKDL